MARLDQIVACLSIVGLAATGAAAAPQRKAEAEQPEQALRLQVSPRAMTAPGHLASLVRVAPEDGRRVLRVVLDSEDFYRSSDIQLDGAAAPRSHFVEWGALPAGTYRVVVTVFGSAGPKTRMSQELEVVGPAR